MQERIICSAVYINDGIYHKGQPINIERGFVVCGRRHSDCYATIEALFKLDTATISCEGATTPPAFNFTQQKDMGFITTENRYVDRKEGMKIAMEANQLLMPHLHKWKSPDDPMYILTSEDLFPYDRNEKQFM